MQALGVDHRQPGSGSQRPGAHAVVHAEHPDLADVPLPLVGVLVGAIGHQAGAVREPEVRVPALDRFEQLRVLRQGRCDSELLRGVVDVGDRCTLGRFDQAAPPFRRAEDELAAGTGRCVRSPR